MKKEEAVEFLLMLKDTVKPVHIKDSKGECTYSAVGFCEAIDVAVTELMSTKD